MNFNQLKKKLSEKLTHAKIEIIGQSVHCREIYCVSFDMGSAKSVIIQGAIHAREHITASLIMRQIQDVDKNFDSYKSLAVPNIYFVPIVNPDGVMLATEGITSVKSLAARKFLRAINGGLSDFSMFKANANGVDLNTNFDAKWGSGVGNKIYPSPHGYIGPAPMSEPCTRALAILTKKVKPFFTISYHAKGEEIYYDFFNRPENLERDRRIAKLFARSLGYKIVSTEQSSSGGYKDWCVERLAISAITIEVGSDSLSHPIGEEHLDKIYKQNKDVIKLLAKISKEDDNAKRRVYERGNKTRRARGKKR